MAIWKLPWQSCSSLAKTSWASCLSLPGSRFRHWNAGRAWENQGHCIFPLIWLYLPGIVVLIIDTINVITEAIITILKTLKSPPLIACDKELLSDSVCCWMKTIWNYKSSRQVRTHPFNLNLDPNKVTTCRITSDFYLKHFWELRPIWVASSVL